MYDSVTPRPAGRPMLAGVLVSALVIAAGGYSSVSFAQSSSVTVDESVLDQLGPPPQNLPRAILQRQDPVQRPQLQMPAPSQRPKRAVVDRPERSRVQLTPVSPASQIQAGRLLPPPQRMPKSRLLMTPAKPINPPARRPERSRAVPPAPRRTVKPQRPALPTAPQVATAPKVSKPRIKTRKIPPPPVLSAPKIEPPKIAARKITPPKISKPAPATPQISEIPKTTLPKAPPVPKLAAPTVTPPKVAARRPQPKPDIAKTPAPSAEVEPGTSKSAPPSAPTPTAPLAAVPKPEVAKRPERKSPTAPPKALMPAPKPPEKAADVASARTDAPRVPSVIPPPAPVLKSIPGSAPQAPVKAPQVAALTAPKAAPPSLSDNGNLLRIPFALNSTEIPEDGKAFLDTLAKRMGKESGLRIQLLGYAGSANGSPSKSRRLSLFRALSVRTYLMKKGIRSTRMDVRALGNRAENGATDRVDAKIRN
ncbi:MAG: OmpA family protein [Alphaproteobacteria bacterium]|nr:OmpA family protein [Alphaproteobacteria bacterium]